LDHYKIAIQFFLQNMFLKFKTRANAVVTQLRGLRGRWRHASSKATATKIAYHAT